MALKTIDVLDTPAATGLFTSDTIIPGTSATLTSTRGNVTLTLAGTPHYPIPNITVGEGKTIKLRGLNSSFVIPGKLNGPGTLEIEGNLTEDGPIISIGHGIIGGGDGNVTFSGTVPAVKRVIILSTGKTTFKKALTGLDDSSDSQYPYGDKGNRILGDVSFEDALTVTDTTITLSGNVSLQNTVFGTGGASYPVTLSATGQSGVHAKLILGAEKTISIGGGKYSGTGAVVPQTPILTAAGGKAELTVFSGDTRTLVLTPGAPVTTVNSTNEDATKRNAGNKLTLTTTDSTNGVTSGNLQVVKDAILELQAPDSATSNLNLRITNTTIGYLSVADGGTISLTDTTNGAIGINIGNTVITYTGANATTANLVATGGVVTLGNNTITGDTTAATLAVTGQAAEITLDGEGRSLDLKKVNLDLTARGSLKITGNTAVNKLILTEGAKLSLAPVPEGSTAVPPAEDAGYDTIGTPTTGAAVRGDISGNAVLNILSSAGTSKTPKAVSLAHDGVGASVNITSGFDADNPTTPRNVVLDRGSAFERK
jgi:hypothetical protein